MTVNAASRPHSPHVSPLNTFPYSQSSLSQSQPYLPLSLASRKVNTRHQQQAERARSRLTVRVNRLGSRI
jgi:hypothetical protein